MGTRRQAGIRAGAVAFVVAQVVVLVVVMATGRVPAGAATAPVPAPAAAADPVGAVEVFGVDMTYPSDMTSGPDGSVWMVDDHRVGRMTTDGVLRMFALPPTLSANAITGGPDGNLWFTSSTAISRMTPTGELTTFETASVGNGAITAGADGNLWFTSLPNGSIGPPGSISRITTSGAVTTFTAGIGHPTDIVAGADGNLWFADSTADTIGRITPAGAVTTFSDPGLRGLWKLALGADGNVWFGAFDPGAATGTIGSITPTGTVDVVAPALGTGVPLGLSAGADGSMWFVTGSSAIGSITPAGTVSWFPLPGAHPYGRDLVLGSDGNQWVVTSTSTELRMAKVSPSGVATDVPVPLTSVPWGITAGGDGSTWFTAIGSNTVGRIDRSGVVTAFADAGIESPAAIVAGVDGNLWFTNLGPWPQGLGSIGRIAPDGVVTTFRAPGIGRPYDIVAGPGGDLWFTMEGAASLGRITVGGAISLLPLSFEPTWLAAGPDGNLWVNDRDGDAVWRVTPDGVASPFRGGGIDRPGDIVAGIDGALWFTNAGQTIGRLTTAGAISTFPTPGSYPVLLAAGPDGNVWFTDEVSQRVGRLAPGGAVTTFADPRVSPYAGIAAGTDGAVWFTDPTGAIGRVTATVEGAPVFVAATAGNRSATVSWQAPPVPVGGPIIGYSVVASPGGASCATSGSTSCTVGGLAAGTAHTFSVSAIGSGGPGPAGVTAAPVTPWSGSGFRPVVPVRILDSRQANVGFAGKVTASSPRSLQVTGRGGPSNVPASATAVVLNVTVTDSTAESFLTVYPTGTDKPNASNLNFGVGQTVPNLVTVKLGTGGKVQVATAVGATNVVADVVGWYDDGSAGGDLFASFGPRRLLDSRVSDVFWPGPLVGTQRVAVRESTDPAEVGNPWGVPPTATALIANVTVTGGSEASFVSVWPSGEPRPNVSNLNFGAGQTVANLVVVAIGDDGYVNLANAHGGVEVILDAVGYFDPTAGSRFHALVPNRVLDTRIDLGLSGPQGPGQSRALAVAGAPGSGVPAGATGLVANVTVTGATSETFVAVYPGGGVRPNPFSNVNAGVNQAIPNLVTVGVAPNGTIDLYNHLGHAELIADAVGYYAPF